MIIFNQVPLNKLRKQMTFQKLEQMVTDLEISNIELQQQLTDAEIEIETLKQGNRAE